MSVDKFRSPELLRLAAGKDCTLRIQGICVTGPCVSAHSNQSLHGKSKSAKADDCFIAWACGIRAHEVSTVTTYLTDF
jgi:hypothetical protein